MPVDAGTGGLRALIWDVDGTLADTERDGHRVAFNSAFAEAGLDWHWGESHYGELLSVPGGKERMLHHWRQVDPVAAAAADAAQRVAGWHRAKTRHYTRLVADGAVRLRPGVRRLLEEARAAGIALAIATTTTIDNVHALLEHTIGREALDWFKAIGAGDVVPRKKPAPDVYVHVLQVLGLEPTQALALEDSAPGARAAVAAGVPVVVTRNPYTERDALPEVLADLDGLGEPQAWARGTVRAHGAAVPWRGVVTLAELRAWHAAGAGQSSQGTKRRTVFE